jgi:Chalcone isomerase-like
MTGTNKATGLRGGRGSLICGLILACVALASLSVGHAAELSGVVMPETQVADGTQMRLNGIGLRTFSVLVISSYVAGLYLERQNDNPDAILHSQERKLLDIRFLRDVDAEDARKAWRDGFEQNCRAPCYLDPRDVKRFLAAVPSMHEGDRSTLLFTSRGAHLTFNGLPMGDIANLHFAETILATFIGPEPPTPRLKRELLGLRD